MEEMNRLPRTCWSGVGTLSASNPSSFLVERARDLASKVSNVSFEVGGCDLPFSEANFDVVVLHMTREDRVPLVGLKTSVTLSIEPIAQEPSSDDVLRGTLTPGSGVAIPPLGQKREQIIQQRALTSASDSFYCIATLIQIRKVRTT